MTPQDIINAARPVYNDAGQPVGVQLDAKTWEALIEILENLEDEQIITEALVTGDDDFVPWEEIEANYLAAHPELNVQDTVPAKSS